ncbi:haloacid dehalogenase-like hydrolase [Nitzschia inconspicua]|uniref:Haloacid dehalogenase-like hydrolase n=1 Tax=Nitzschia inconspicua TaxID=303405 RepID=A0A9K3LZV6_9STRA|nr:haloacid dehalogenase-like hydrolase [Nitzschia inconspicua]
MLLLRSRRSTTTTSVVRLLYLGLVIWSCCCCDWWYLSTPSHYYGAHAFTLVTFDVDGTLIQGSGQAAEASLHAQAFSHAVRKVLASSSSGNSNKNQKDIPPVAQALPRELYHGSTDGLILLRLAQATLDMDATESFPYLPQMMDCMYEFMLSQSKEDATSIGKYISPLPGVMEHLTELANRKDSVMCGLVTGNVEGIARLKMKTVGIYETGVLAEACETQRIWDGTQDIAFLGGFGSDFCSGNIVDLDRNHLDRGEQIAIAVQRCQRQLAKRHSGTNNNNDPPSLLKRVVHVGDAPADVLAAKALSERTLQNQVDDELCVGMVAVATGSYPADLLQELAGSPIPGKWEPVVLEQGMGDPMFLKACGL